MLEITIDMSAEDAVQKTDELMDAIEEGYIVTETIMGRSRGTITYKLRKPEEVKAQG